MPEAITKYALNSTLGTDGFQPLDKMIVGQKMFVASDTPIVTMPSRDTDSTESLPFAEFTPRINGTLKFTCLLDAIAYSSPRAYLTIKEEGTTIFSVSARGEEVNVETIFNLSKNKKYTFNLSSNASTTRAYVYDFKLSGDIVDSNWFDFEEIIMPE